MNESNERKCYDYYFQNSKQKDYTPKSELAIIVTAWHGTPEQMATTAQGMCAALWSIGGYKHGKIRVYCGDRLENEVSF